MGGLLTLLLSHPIFAQVTSGETPIDNSTDETIIFNQDDFVEVKAGTFQMGSPLDEEDRDSNETPHLVTLTQGFEIQITEVTQIQYFLVTGENPSFFSQEEYCLEDYKVIQGQSFCPDHPVERVSWNEVKDFIPQLNGKDDQYTYRLPTEAEWEYAAGGVKVLGSLQIELIALQRLLI